MAVATLAHGPRAPAPAEELARALDDREPASGTRAARRGGAMSRASVLASDAWSLLPGSLGGAGVVLLLLDAFAPRLRRAFMPLALAATVAAAVRSPRRCRLSASASFGGFLEGDR